MGPSAPTGSTQFRFQSAGFRFESTSYQWLVVAGARAQFKGVGTVNGNSGYGFMVTATDGDEPGGGGTDKFRIKVWQMADGTIVFDNVLGSSDDINSANPQVIGAGSVNIQLN